ncbi:hypothetical protein [Methylocystis parvus]|uniref:hypothetical protein n=1 Tax=Methylocystis parvus TaxID=134 RepID=UPI003C783829
MHAFDPSTVTVGMDLIPAEEADRLASKPAGWARARAAAGGLGGRMIGQRVFVRRSSVLCFLETAKPTPRGARPAHLRLVVDNDRAERETPA